MPGDPTISAMLYDSDRVADTAEQDAYFSELLGYGVERLAHEPELLRVEQDQLARQVQETAAANYKAFITASRCLEGLRSELDRVCHSLETLEADLPRLQTAATTFRRGGVALAARREALRSLYANHPVLLELLELAALMDTCVRAGNCDEALDLKSFAAKLAVGHGDLPVVKRLLEDVAAASDGMLEALLQRLAGPVQLPECLRVIGYLRRLSPFSERQLRQSFLQRREAWIASMLVDLDDRSPYEFLKRLTDVHRLHLFDVAMQYRAIFADGDDGGVLYYWAHCRVAAYLHALELHLPRITEGGALASVMDAAMYCGASLGRVGLDFRPLLAMPFEVAAAALFQRGVAASSEAVTTMLQSHKWVALPSAATRVAALQRQLQQQKEQQQIATDDANASEQGNTGSTATGAPREALAPPVTLIEHAPLAVYTNGLLAAFNELRHCAPAAARGPTASALQHSLVAAATALARQGVVRSLSEEERPVWQSACTAFKDTLRPFAATCFGRIYIGGESLLDVADVEAAFASEEAYD